MKKKIVEEFYPNITIFSFYYINEKLIYICNDFKNGIVQMVNNFNFENRKVLIKGTKMSNLLTSPKPFQEIGNEKIIINLSFYDTLVVFDLKDDLIESKYVLGNIRNSLTRFSADKIIDAFLVQRNLTKLEPILIPWGFVTKLEKYLILPVIPSNKCVVINLKDDNSFYLDFQKHSGKLRYVSAKEFPAVIKNEDNEVYSILTVSDFRQPEKEKVYKDYISVYNKLSAESFQNPVIARFKLK